jgi:hypothetical protein
VQGTGGRVQRAQQHTVVADHGGGVLERSLLDKVADRCRDVDGDGGCQVGPDSTAVTDVSLGGQAENRPTGPPADQIVDPRETELIETARGSGTEVSMLIEAIDDHRPRPIELLDCVGIEGLEGQAHRAREVLLDEDRVRQDVHHQRAVVHQLAGPVDIDPLHDV